MKKTFQAVIIALFMGLIINFLATWFSAPQLSMNLSGKEAKYEGISFDYTCIVDIENRGSNSSGARILLDIPENYVNNELVAAHFDPPTKIRLIPNLVRSQIEIDTPILQLRAMERTEARPTG